MSNVHYNGGRGGRTQTKPKATKPDARVGGSLDRLKGKGTDKVKGKAE